MDAGLAIAASGMLAEQIREDQLANDLANASTPGYKPDESSQRDFGSILLANAEGETPIGSLPEGVTVAKTFTNMTQGTIAQTGEPLDFAIEGSGFFAVQTAQGVRYTRDGQFTSSAAGVLTDADGDPVLDQALAPVKVGSNGSVAASALGVFEVPAAEKQGEDLYVGTASGHSDATVHQGALEQSSLDAAKAMVEMVGAMRDFQSGQQAIQAIAQTLQDASTQVGSLSSS